MGKAVDGLGVTTLREIAEKYSHSDLVQRFGDSAAFIWNICHGVDDSEVKELVKMKSMNACKSFPTVYTRHELDRW